MTKLEFLTALEARLSALPAADVKRSVDYYAEMLDDYSDDGLDTDEAVRKMGGIDAIVQEIINEAALACGTAAAGTESKDERTAEKEKCGECTGSAQVWLRRLIAFCTVFMRTVCVAVAVAGYIASVLLIASGAAALVTCVCLLVSGSVAPGVFMLGLALVSAALGALIGVVAYYLRKCLKEIFKSLKNKKRKGDEQK